MSRLRHFNVPEEDFNEFSEQCTEAFMKSARINENGHVKWHPTTIINVLAQKPITSK